MTPRFLPPKPISESTLREVDARLDRRIRELEAQVHRLAEQVAALHLGSTCHPDWVNPGKGSVAAARRASVVEAVLAAAGPKGMNLPELSAYLHIPMSRRDTLFADLSYLIQEERAERVPTRAKRWRIKEK